MKRHPESLCDQAASDALVSRDQCRASLPENGVGQKPGTIIDSVRRNFGPCGCHGSARWNDEIRLVEADPSVEQRSFAHSSCTIIWQIPEWLYPIAEFKLIPHPLAINLPPPLMRHGPHSTDSTSKLKFVIVSGARLGRQR